MLRKFLIDDEGATAIEYGLIASIVAIGIVASLTLVGSELKTTFSGVATNFQAINN